MGKKGSGGVFGGGQRKTPPDPFFHYSYSAYADPAMAESFDAKRFGGPIGQILLSDQEQVLSRFLGDVSGRRILDLGTGTGRAAIALARGGAVVTGVDASSAMLRVARTRADDAGLVIDFAEGDAQKLPYPDRAFDSSVCLRLFMHVPNWRQAISELCRVTERRVVFDYPALASVASAQAVWRRAMLNIGRQVESYRVFREAAVSRELTRHGFRIVASHKQFVLPIAFHKLIGSAGFTRGVEAALAQLGLQHIVGSPVTIAAERCAF